jgi:hypothetical protein
MMVKKGTLCFSTGVKFWVMNHFEFEFCTSSVPQVLIIKSKKARNIVFLDESVENVVKLESIISHKSREFHAMRSVLNCSYSTVTPKPQNVWTITLAKLRSISLNVE